MQMIEVSKLKPHPRNKEFFDDITGDRWKDFIKSIVRRGIIEAIVVTEDPITHELIIVSGHQRVRACDVIHILEAPCRIVHYPDFDEKTGTPREDMILEDLICTNIMQRGVGNVNPMKMAKCIKELERIYGIKKGNNQNSLLNNSTSKTQSDIANELDIDRTQYLNYKKLNNLIPELQSLVEGDALKSTTAYKIWAKLPKIEQEKFFNEIGKEKIKQITQKETKKIIEEKQQLEQSNKVLQQSYNELSTKYNNLQNIKDEIQILRQKLKEKPKEIIKEIEIKKEVIPNDYQELKQKVKEKDKYYNDLKKDYDIKVKEMFDLEDQIKTLQQKSEVEQYTKKLQASALTFCTRVHNFIETSSGLAWLSEHINELPNYEKNSYIKAIQLMEDWVLAVKSNMKNYL